MLKTMLFFCSSLLLAAAACGGSFSDQQISADGLSRNRISIPAPQGTTPLLYPVDFQLRFSAAYRVPEHREDTLRLIGTPGDLYSGALMLVMPGDWKPAPLAVAFTALRGPKGEIAPSQLRLLEALEPKANKENRISGAALVQPDFTTLRKGDALPLLWSVEIPRGTVAGTYTGSVRIGGAAVKIELQVLPFKLPVLTESAGFYLPGHFYRPNGKGIYTNYTYPTWTRENMERYFRFCNARRFNSATLYHIYPEFDAAGKADFSELTAFARGMRSAGMNGKLILELRHMTWRASEAAIRRARAEKSTLRAKKGELHPGAPAVFEEYLRQLLDTAKREQYPPLLIATEEELANAPGKDIVYRQFLPVLRKLCPDLIVIIDNQVGYNRPVELDRGRRDRIPTRQYNSWTEEALADARKDGATVGSFNYDLHRMSFGLLQIRLNSKLHHQWADQWNDRGWTFWRYLVATSGGVISTWEFERLHAGRIDLAAANLLKSEIGKLRARGETNRALQFEKVLDDVTCDIPVNGPRYRDWQLGVTGRELDLRRAQIFRAICEARNAKAVFPPAPGTPALKPLRHVGRTPGQGSGTSGTLTVKLAGEMKLDARHDEPAYVGTGAIPYVVSVENNIKARCSTAAEFAKFAPSYSAGFVACNRDGLWFAADGNHWQPKGDFRYKHSSDSPDIWEDDSFQFFWYEPTRGNLYQLLINLKGERTLLVNGKVLKNNKIKAFARSPINASGGTAVEAFVPWEAMNLAAIPSAGTVWDFNYAREFHSYRQLTSFGRVNSQFAERAQWGRLLFSGETATRLFESLDLPPLYPGRNRIAGRIGKAAAGTNLKLQMTAADGRTLASCPIRAGERFSLNFTVGSEKQLRLQLLADGKTIEQLLCAAEPSRPSVAVRKCETRNITGTPLLLEIQTCCASLDRPSLHVKVEKGAKSIALPPLKLEKNGSWELALDTSGLEPGEWFLTARLGDCGNTRPSPPVSFRILPDFRSVR